MKEFKLLEPDESFEESFYKLSLDYKNNNENKYQLIPDFNHENYIKYLYKILSMKNIQENSNLVPETTYWMTNSTKEIFGIIRLRHYLNEKLKKEGGHVGYDVPPSKRNKGYAAKMLSLLIEKTKEKGIKEILITCDKDNEFSSRVITKNFGVLISEEISEFSGKKILRYKISL